MLFVAPHASLEEFGEGDDEADRTTENRSRTGRCVPR
jgi:hypothetical protein